MREKERGASACIDDEIANKVVLAKMKKPAPLTLWHSPFFGLSLVPAIFIFCDKHWR